MIKLRFRRLTTIRNWLIAGGVFVAVLYPIVISPWLDPKSYKEIQKITRKDIVQEDIQPGNMRVWRDPFSREK